MSIYIISNNEKIDKLIFKNIEENDIVIFMNNQYWKKNFNKSKSKKFLFLRSQNNTFTKYKKTFNNQFKIVYFINDQDYDLNLYHNFKDNKELINSNYLNKILKNINYPINQIPSTGFIVFNYILKEINNNKSIFYNRKINLVGFYFDNKYYKNMKHNFKFEKEIYKKNNIKIL